MGAAGFGAGEFNPAVHRNFLELGAQQKAQAAAFQANATKSEIDTVNRALSGSFIDDLKRMRAIAAAAPFEGGAVRSVSGAQWFDVATQYIDALKTVEDQVAANVVAVVQAVASEARWTFWGIAVLFAVLLVIAGGLTFVIARSITVPLSGLASTMGVLAENNNNVEVAGTDRGDEIGAMARAVLVFPRRGDREGAA